jgi:hypothetical protein
MTVLHFDYETISGMLSDPAGKLSDEDIAKGDLKIGTVLSYDKHMFTLEENSAGKYKFVWKKT